MRLKKLTLKNYLTYADATVDFSNIRKALILGIRNRDASISNASGKSNLLRSIPWCIWGVNSEADNIDQNVKWGTDFCSVKIEFEHKGSEVSVTRTRSLKSKSSTLDFVIDGKNSNGASIDETNANIINFLNLDYNAYINSVYIKQNDIFSLANSRDKNESRELLERVLGLNEYDDFYEETQDVIDGLSASKASILEFIEANSNIDSLISDNESLISSAISSIEKNTLQNKSIKEGISLLKKEYDSLKEVILSRNSIADKISSTERLLLSMEAELDDMINKARAFKANQDIKKNKCMDILAGVDQLNQEQKDLSISIDENKKAKDRIEDIKNEIKEKTLELDRLRRQSVDIEKRVNVLKHDANALKDEIAVLEFKKGNPSIAVGSKCDVCFVDITKDTLQHYLEHIGSLVGDKNRVIEEKRAEAQSLAPQYKSINASVTSLNESITSLNKEKEDLLHGIISDDVISYKKSSISKKQEEIDGAKVEIEKINSGAEIENWKNTIKKKKSDIALLKEDLQKNKDLSSLDDDYQNKKNRLGEINAQIESMNQDFNKADSEIHILNANLISYRSKKQEFDIIKDKIAKKTIELTDLNLSLSVYQNVLNAFSPKGIRYHVLGTAIEDLERTANEILPKIASGNLSISFETKKEIKKSKTGQTEKLVFDAYINDGEKIFPFSSYSGGEQFRISFVIRVALSKLLLKRANSDLEFLIVDEAFAPLDQSGVELMIATINDLQEYFKTILVIAHRSDVKQYFDDVITIHRDKYTSRIEA